MRVSLVAMAVLLAAAPAAAQEKRFEHNFYAKAGAFFPSVDSNLRIDSNNGSIGTIVDLESDLGLPVHKTLPFGLVGWRFSENWRAEVEYFSLARESTKVIDRALTIGDTTYPVNASVTSGLSTSVWRIAVGHSFTSGSNFDFGGNVGIHLSDFAVFIEGSGTVGNMGGALQSERRNQLVPLPTFGLYGVYDINKTFSVAGRVNYFQLKISDYKGQLLDASIGVVARITPNLGLGADFRYVDYGLRAEAEDFTGRINYNFYGPFVYATLGF